MGNVLSDGTVLPHYFTTMDTSWETTGQYDNTPLRIGEIVDVVLPTDKKRSVTKKLIEYTVAVQQRDGAGILCSILYNHCLRANLFGGVADKFTFTLRKSKTNPSIGLSIGSKVLVLCINGETGFAVIVGGMPDVELGAVEVDLGHNLYFEFNGLNTVINKDGEMILTVKGATNFDGTPASNADTTKTGQYVKLTKDGSIRLGTNGDDQYLLFDNAKKTISLVADQELDVTSSRNVVVKSTGVLVGSATDFWMLGSTYRAAEATCNQQLIAALGAIATAATTAAAALTTASGSLGLGIIGNIPAAAPVGVAASQIAIIAAQALKAVQAITSLEANPTIYLSPKNKND